jgi:hypothetical protein
VRTVPTPPDSSHADYCALGRPEVLRATRAAGCSAGAIHSRRKRLANWSWPAQRQLSDGMYLTGRRLLAGPRSAALSRMNITGVVQGQLHSDDVCWLFDHTGNNGRNLVGAADRGQFVTGAREMHEYTPGTDFG